MTRGVNPLRPPLYRFKEKIKALENGCWEWTGALNSDGYGNLRINRKTIGSHRFAYETFNSQKIPPTLEIDHLCRNPKCVNPKHLEAVTHRENMLRGSSLIIGQWQKAKTHCPKGHPYNTANTRYLVRGGRQCRVCDKIYQKNRRKEQCEKRKQILTLVT